MKKYGITALCAILMTAAIAFAAQTLTNYGATPTLQIPSLNYQGWGTVVNNNLKALDDFNAVAHNPDGTLKSTTTASQWITGSAAVTYVSASSLKVADTEASVFIVGRKVWVNQTADVIGVVASTSSSGGFTTVTLSSIVLYSDNVTSSTVTTPITSVSVGIDTLRSDPSPKNTGRGAYSNLVVKRASVSTVTVTADSITLSSSTATYDALSVSLTCDMATDLDAGLSESPDTFFSIWVSSDGTTETCIIDDGTADPADAGAYIRRVGWVRNDASSDVIDFIQYADRYFQRAVYTTDKYLSAGTSDSFVLVTPTVPSTAVAVFVVNDGTQDAEISIDGTNSLGYAVVAGGGSIGNSPYTTVPLDSNQQHYCKRRVATNLVNLENIGHKDPF